MKEKSASSTLQDVAVDGSDVENEHAPKHAPIFGAGGILNLCCALKQIILTGDFNKSTNALSWNSRDET